ncbi:hypothetical protein KR018_012404 [Drosophila ironensis]|nr:hypothetical protein KR018_012404 [Drosophila ironensis]
MPPMWYKLLKILVLLFALFTTTTTADSAPLMPINTMLGNQAENPIPIPNQNQNQKQKQSPKPRSSSIYHQYHSLNNHQDQYFKGSNTQAQADQAPTTHKHPSDTFVFPETRPRPTYPPLPPLVSNISKPQQECGDNEPLESKSFCTTVKNYPDLSALKGKLSGKFAKFFNEEVPVELSSRVGTGDDEVYLCQSVTRTLYPKMGQKAEDSSWQFIVNDDEFKQGIQVEECTNPGEHCDYTDSFPSRYKTICKQHYVSRNLVSIKNDGKLDVAQDTFKIPSCCKCVLKPI